MHKEILYIHNPKDIKFAVDNQTSDSYQIHYHPFHEIYYFVKGDADYLVEGKEYHLTPHSLILLSPHTFHGVRINSSNDYIRCAIHFDASQLLTERRSFLLSSFPGNKKNSPKEVFYENTEKFELETFFRQLIASQRQPEPLSSQYYPIFLESLLAQISLMCSSLRPTLITSSAPSVVTDIIHYLNEHLTEPVSLDSLSERFFISKYYMNRAFKKATGTTVMDYLIYKRVVMAKHLILNGHTALDASLLSGFGDYSSFYRSYCKVMGCGPSKDRKDDNDSSSFGLSNLK